MSNSISNNQGLSDKAVQNLKSTAASLKLYTISFLIILGMLAIALLFCTYTIFKLPELKSLIIFLLIGYGYVGFSVYIQLQLLKASSGFSSFVEQKRTEGLEDAYTSMKMYWKFSGFLTIGTIAATILAVGIFVVAFKDVVERMF
jgi:Trk-type K+ transport system membrane component